MRQSKAAQEECARPVYLPVAIWGLFQSSSTSGEVEFVCNDSGENCPWTLHTATRAHNHLSSSFIYIPIEYSYFEQNTPVNFRSFIIHHWVELRTCSLNRIRDCTIVHLILYENAHCFKGNFVLGCSMTKSVLEDLKVLQASITVSWRQRPLLLKLLNALLSPW